MQIEDGPTQELPNTYRECHGHISALTTRTREETIVSANLRPAEK